MCRVTVTEKFSDLFLVLTIKHKEESAIFWGCFEKPAVGGFIKNDGILVKEGYKQIFQRYAILKIM